MKQFITDDEMNADKLLLSEQHWFRNLKDILSVASYTVGIVGTLVAIVVGLKSIEVSKVKHTNDKYDDSPKHNKEMIYEGYRLKGMVTTETNENQW